MNIKKLAAEVTLLPVVFDGGNMTKDMTTGSPVRLIIGFAIPMFLGMLFQQFYSMVDTLVVGRFSWCKSAGRGRFHHIPQLYGYRILHRCL